MTKLTRRTTRLIVAGIVGATLLWPVSAASADHPSAADEAVFISEYVDGELSDRAVEVYNGSDREVDLEAEGYALQTHFLMWGFAFHSEVPLSGVLAPGATHVAVYESSHPDLVDVADQVFSAFPWDGDDVVVLARGGAVADVVGQLGHVPAAGNAMDDTVLRRLAHVARGDGDPHDAFDATLEWSSQARTDWSDLGSHTVSTSTCTPLVDRDATLGTVCASVTGGLLSVVWTADAGATLRHVALASGANPADIPRSNGKKGGSVLVSQFPHRVTPDADAASWTLTVPAPDTAGGDVVVAAVADVGGPQGGGTEAWGAGTAFFERGNGGSWFAVPVG